MADERERAHAVMRGEKENDEEEEEDRRGSLSSLWPVIQRDRRREREKDKGTRRGGGRLNRDDTVIMLHAAREIARC